LHLNGRSHAGHTLPQLWSTKGWLATDGSPGCLENFNGTQLGDAATPVVFRVGLDWHVRLTYEDKSKSGPIGTITVADGSTTVTGTGTAFQNYHKGRTLRVAGEPIGYVIDTVSSTTGIVLKQSYKGATAGVTLHGQSYTIDPPATKDIPVAIHTGRPHPPSAPAKQRLRTDDKGEAHGVIFDIQGEETVYFRVYFEIEDASINLPRGSVEMPVGPETDYLSWLTYFLDDDQMYFPDMQQTSVGSFNDPRLLRCTTDDRNVALYFLKILRELSLFLFHVTGGAWAGVNNLVIHRYLLPPANRSFSWPVGSVWLRQHNHWDRSTIVHELSHQVVWKEAGYSTLDIALEARLLGNWAFFGSLELWHDFDLFANPEQALIEGWPEFIAAIFAGTRTPPYAFNVNPVTLQREVFDPGGTIHTLGPPPNGRGESVEGALANGLWAIFEKFIVTSTDLTAVGATSAHVPESLNGDITASGTPGSWVAPNPGVRDRWFAMIWEPLQSLRSDSDQGVTALLDDMRMRNPTDWHLLQPELQAFNMAMAPPVMASITPPTGASVGGTIVTISGSNFVQGMGVRIGGIALFPPNAIVNSHGSITVVTPPAPGPIPPGGLAVDVQVTTNAGSDTVSGGFTYL
jgi:hypothetical protein